VTGFGSVGFSLRVAGCWCLRDEEVTAALGGFSSTGIPACAGVETRCDRGSLA